MIFRHTDEELLEGLRQNKNYYIEFVYHEYGPIIRFYIRQNSGNIQDVEDILQDTVIKLYQCIRSPAFKLECSLKTFVIAISKKLWLQRLERKYRLMYQADYEVNEPTAFYAQEEKDRDDILFEQDRLFFKHLAELPSECKQLLHLYFLKVPYKEIAKLMNLKDDVYVKTRKYYCKNLLRKKILSDPDYLKIANDNGNTNVTQLDRSLH